MDLYFDRISVFNDAEDVGLTNDLKKYKEERKIDIITSIFFLILILVLFLLNTCIFPNSAILKIIMFTILVIFSIYCTIREKKQFKQFDIRIENYESKLKTLKKILSDNKLNLNTTNDSQNESNGNNEQSLSWYTQNKINYLIKIGEKIIDESNAAKEKTDNLIGTYILPIVTFVAVVIQGNASIIDALTIGLWSLEIIVSFYIVKKGISFLSDLLFNSSSIYKIKLFIDILNDLLAIDFME